MGPEFQPREFFEALLPALLAQHHQALRHLRGRLAITLGGGEPASWTIDFGASPPSIAEGPLGEVDLRIEIDPAHVSPMLRGELDLEAAQTDGTVHVEGDRQLLSRFARALAPTNALGLRLRLDASGVK